ncbi:Transcription factor [Penicillium cf. griseofulvum]|uniref:Transcription factor n=1 Tax=Penicillium cf. griseofulvum TaxID=2972120 RepID=A0A9W9IWZ5_9EURO|nr:Transcription factor [Penicillium cf. griseofulvum]KAJ5429276.1 Transcription factor [Penicillium cf. griseofulvum]
MTTTKYRESFTLKGVVYNNIDRSEMASLWYDVNMPACNTSREYGNWSIRVPQRASWDTESWDDFDVPIMRAGFSAHAASLVMDGSFVASPYLRSNVSNYQGPKMLSRTTIRGNIQVRFEGVFDAYHSDILDVNSTAPAWLRTVGFGNNSLNIADSSGERHVRSALLSTLGVPFLVAAMVYM